MTSKCTKRKDSDYVGYTSKTKHRTRNGVIRNSDMAGKHSDKKKEKSIDMPISIYIHLSTTKDCNVLRLKLAFHARACLGLCTKFLRFLKLALITNLTGIRAMTSSRATS